MNKKAKPLPMEIIRESLELDPASATHLRWKTRPRHQFSSDGDWNRWNTRYAGAVAGTVLNARHGKLYWQVQIDRRTYKAHRIVFALAHGVNPGEMEVDHWDGDSRNNDPSNLRIANHSENQRNRGAQRNNTSGKKGVSWNRRRQKWEAYIGINGRRRHLGYFDNIDAAAAAYAAAAAELHGEFAKTA